MRKINRIILHCTATPEGKHFDVDTIRRWHVKDRGWKDIGYHYVIELDGQIQAGRPVELLGAHCLGQNKFSIGVCYVGGMNKAMTKPKDTRTEEQKESLINLIADIRKKYPNVTIHGHN